MYHPLFTGSLAAQHTQDLRREADLSRLAAPVRGPAAHKRRRPRVARWLVGLRRRAGEEYEPIATVSVATEPLLHLRVPAERRPLDSGVPVRQAFERDGL